jgi:hypothetical protein
MYTRSNSQNRKNKSSYDLLAHKEKTQPALKSAVSSPRLLNIAGPILETNGRNRKQSVPFGNTLTNTY